MFNVKWNNKSISKREGGNDRFALMAVIRGNRSVEKQLPNCFTFSERARREMEDEALDA